MVYLRISVRYLVPTLTYIDLRDENLDGGGLILISSMDRMCVKTN